MATCSLKGELATNSRVAVNSVPVVAAEIPHAAREYTIVFSEHADGVIPLALLGVEDKQNLYVTDEGGWDAKYVPAFVRRYPFVFAQSQDAQTYTLCIDESWQGCNREGRGERLISEQGERTPFLEKLMGFLQDFQRNSQRTTTYGQKLKDLGLLEPKEANFTLGEGKKLTLRGFMAVNREKLNALPAETLRELAQTGELEVTYAHLLSMNNLSVMLDRAAKRALQLNPTPSVPSVE